ncbi:alcohol dehydrogenase [Hydrogenophaga sp. OTU3427]|uniref:alcohol dehydrogenase n=1 Tax=Hydrogenophaga sp. OTU3427 TaxID=3043856 RepID=UPI00313C67D1
MKCVHLPGFRSLLELVDKPTPVPTGTEVLLKVLGAGMCHSDAHIWEGQYDLGGGRSISMAERIRFPLVMGHETSGEVVALGPQANGAALGARYAVCSWIGCGACHFCAAGDEHLCATPRFLGVNRDGGYADHVLVPHPRYLVDIGDLDPVAAAPLVCSGLTTYSALKKAGPQLQHERIVMFGAGGLGLMALNLLRILGAPGAVVLEPDAVKRDAAMAAGAIAAIDPRAADVAEQVRAALGQPVRFVLDLVGSGESATLGFELLERAGKMVVVGLFGGAMQLSVPLLPMRAATLQGSYIGSPAELRELVALVRERGGLAMPIDRRSLADADTALQDLRAGRVVGRVVLVP